MRLASLGTLWPGDLAWKHANGACFLVQDPAVEQPRAERFEISPSAPLYGYKVTLAQGQAGLLEQALLEKEELRLRGLPPAGRPGHGRGAPPSAGPAQPASKRARRRGTCVLRLRPAAGELRNQRPAARS